MPKLGLVVGLVLLALLFLPRINELCVVRLTGQGATLVRGRAPAGLLSDFGEIARRAGLSDAKVSVVSEGGAPRLRANSLDDTIAQPLRNVVGQYNVMQFRTGKRPS